MLCDGLKGLEKESLRLSEDGKIAQTQHPTALGSPLTHPYITTDYSEALIELITPPFVDSAATLDFLVELHTFVYRSLGEELLLAMSMPCGLDGDESIPIARYGDSNIGQMKHIYRRGLGYRYGRGMQAIAGVHFNYSVNEDLWPVLHELEGGVGELNDFISTAYFGLLRNFHRNFWLLLYLFGTSPAVCRSFFKGREELAAEFPEFDAGTLYRPFATSLRMSDIGYRNDSQAGLNVSLDGLEPYVESLAQAIGTPSERYDSIGVKVDGEYRQLNTNILQIENEFYSPVRPKQVAKSGEKPTLALKRRGVRYVEVRALDLDYRSPAGANVTELRFVEVLLLTCLLTDSPPLSAAEKSETGRNGLMVACCGRKPGLTLQKGGKDAPLRAWGTEILDQMKRVATILDDHGSNDERVFSEAVETQRELLAEPDFTPSARMLAEMRSSGQAFADYALNVSRTHAEYLRYRPVDPAWDEEFRIEAAASLREQRRIEAADTLTFDEFLAGYFKQA